MKLRDNVAIVTGGGGSIGRAVALELAGEGAAVVVADFRAEQARAVASEVEARGGTALALEVDVRERDAVNAMVEAVLARFSRTDILVTCHGGSAREQSTLFCESEAETLDWVLGVNLMGVIYCLRAVINPMIEQQRGKIVTIGSILALQGKEGHVDYATAKGGVIAMTRSLAMEVGRHGINVNCVSPGLVPRGAESEGFAERTSYLHRVCTPEDVAHLVGFLVSDEASYVTGQNYLIDGGRSLGLRGDR